MDLTRVEERILHYIARHTTIIENNEFYEAVGISAHEAKRALNNLLDRMVIHTNGVYSLSEAGREWVEEDAKSDDNHSKYTKRSRDNINEVNVNVGTLDNLCQEVGKMNAHFKNLIREQDNNRRTLDSYQDTTARTLSMVTRCKELIDATRRDQAAISARLTPIEKETWGGGKKPGLVHWRDTSWRKIGRFLLMLAWLFIIPMCLLISFMIIQIYIINLELQALELEIQTLQSTSQCDIIDTLTIWNDLPMTRVIDLPTNIFDEKD